MGGCEKWHFFIWNRVRIWRTERHTPTKKSYWLNFINFATQLLFILKTGHNIRGETDWCNFPPVEISISCMITWVMYQSNISHNLVPRTLSFLALNYLNQSTNQNDGLAGRCQGLFPPHIQGKASWGRGWISHLHNGSRHHVCCKQGWMSPQMVWERLWVYCSHWSPRDTEVIPFSKLTLTEPCPTRPVFHFSCWKSTKRTLQTLSGSWRCTNR